MTSAGRVLMRSAREIRVYIQANPYSITVMSFLGGCLLKFCSFLTLFRLHLVNPSPLTYILQCYQVFFGLLIVFVDGPSQRLPPAVVNKMRGLTLFLQSRPSRIAFYLFIACQQASQAEVY